MSDRPVIVYDGECRFCRWSVRRIHRLDRASRFEYLPRQAPGVEQRFPILARSDFDTGLRLIFPDDGAGPGAAVHVGADAVYQVYRRLPPYHLVAWLYRVPGLTWLFRFGYALVARNRHRLGRVSPDLACSDPACDVSYGERRSRQQAAETPSL